MCDTYLNAFDCFWCKKGGDDDNDQSSSSPLGANPTYMWGISGLESWVWTILDVFPKNTKKTWLISYIFCRKKTNPFQQQKQPTFIFLSEDEDSTPGRLLRIIASIAPPLLSMARARDLSNLAWAFATLDLRKFDSASRWPVVVVVNFFQGIHVFWWIMGWIIHFCEIIGIERCPPPPKYYHLHRKEGLIGDALRFTWWKL